MGLETGLHPAGGCHSGTRKTDCNRGLAHHESEPAETLSELSSGVESGGVVDPGIECGLDGLFGKHLFRTGPVVIGMDETIERQRGQQIRAKGIYRDPVHSSKSHFVKASGLWWVSLMLLVNIPWTAKIWALPFLTVLAPSERYNSRCARQPKKLTD